jgi:hypothetical protein
MGHELNTKTGRDGAVYKEARKSGSGGLATKGHKETRQTYFIWNSGKPELRNHEIHERHERGMGITTKTPRHEG